MKILLVGSDYVWSIERVYRKYLLEAGADTVQLFAAQNLFYSYYNRSLLHKALSRAGLSGIYKRINGLLLKEIDSMRPDVIWVFKGMEVMPSLLRICREKGIPLANFNGDNPFIFSGRGSGNRNVIEGLPLYDMHMTYNLKIREEIEEKYNIRTELLPFGFDVSDEVYAACRREEEVKKICFLGNPDSTRISFIKELAGAGMSIDIYGAPEWAELASLPLISVFPPVYEDGFWKNLRRYRVQLNLMRPHNEDSHNMRSFEIPGIGGIMLAPATTEHKLFFKDGCEAFLFNDNRECVEKAAYILSLSREEADKIRDQARKRSLIDGYTYRQRAASALCYLQELYEKAGDHSL
ncbi:MAG TPA: glycosyltransferase [Puia sp.]